jgi:hypothetical protein
MTEGERAALAEFADVTAARIKRAFNSITARPSSSRLDEGRKRMVG